MIEVDVYKAGQWFGELALINNIKRSATITALDDSHFATLDKENFNKIMSKIIKKKFKNQLDFLANFPFLDSISRVKKEKLWFSLK